MSGLRDGKRRAFLGSMAGIGAGLAFPALSAEVKADAISEAKSENGLMLYSGAELAVNTELLAAFQKEYPVVKEPKLVRAGGPALFERIETEYRTGRVQCDVLLSSGSVWFKWIQEGKIMRHASAEYQHYPRQYKVDGYIAAVRAATMTLSVNAQKVRPQDRPRQYKDLLDPKWKGGLIGIADARQSAQGRAWYTVARHYLGRDFMVRLAGQKPLVIRGGGDLIARLISGEVAVAVQTSDRAIRAKRKGAPVEVGWPAEGVVLAPGYAGIMAKAPHPATARLFMDFVMGGKGLEILATRAGYHVLRQGTARPPDVPDVSSLKIWEFDERKIAELTNEINKEFTELFA